METIYIILATIVDVFKALGLGADELIEFGSSVLSSEPAGDPS